MCPTLPYLTLVIRSLAGEQAGKINILILILTKPAATPRKTWMTFSPAFRHATMASAAESPAPTISTGFAFEILNFSSSMALSSDGSSYFSHGSDLLSPFTPSRLTKSLPPLASTTLLHAIKNGFFVTRSNLHVCVCAQVNK
jgi:hypothetical protein